MKEGAMKEGSMKGGGFCKKGCHEGTPSLSGQQAGGTHPTVKLSCYHYFSALLFSTAFSLKIHSSLVFALSYKDVIFRSNLSTQHKKRKKPY